MLSAVDNYTQKNESVSFGRTLPAFAYSVSALPENKRDARAQFVADGLRRAGIENVDVIQSAKHPLVYGDWLHAPGKPTVHCYGHYDVQPPDPLELEVAPRAEHSRRQHLRARRMR